MPGRVPIRVPRVVLVRCAERAVSPILQGLHRTGAQFVTLCASTRYTRAVDHVTLGSCTMSVVDALPSAAYRAIVSDISASPYTSPRRESAG